MIMILQLNLRESFYNIIVTFKFGLLVVQGYTFMFVKK